MTAEITIAELTALFAVAFTGGLAGSAHCVGMCGPFVGVSSLRGRTPPTPLPPTPAAPAFTGASLPLATGSCRGGRGRALANHGFYQLGRLTAYLSLAVLAGTFGHLLLRLGSVVRLQAALAVAMAVMLCAIGATYLFGREAKTTARTIPLLTPILTFARQTGGATGAYVTGLCASLLPCGFLYSFAVAGALTGSLAGSIVTLLGFFAGTLPALGATAFLARAFRGFGFARGGRRLVGVALITLGLVGLFGKVQALPTLPASADTVTEAPDCCEASPPGDPLAQPSSDANPSR